MGVAKVKSRTEVDIPDPINHPDYKEEREVVAYPEGHTVWDQIVVPVTPGMTLQQMLDFFTKEHKITVTAWAMETPGKQLRPLYNQFIASTKANLGVALVTLISEKVGWSLEGKLRMPIQVNFENSDGDEVETPAIILQFNA